MAWQQETFTESYWSVCWKWGFIPYPCRKTRTVTKWCAYFDWVTTRGFVFWCSHEGCMEGQLYYWSGSCLATPGTFYSRGVNACFWNRLEPAGNCPPDPFGSDFVERRRLPSA
jgi:hypothetical protein